MSDTDERISELREVVSKQSILSREDDLQMQINKLAAGSRIKVTESKPQEEMKFPVLSRSKLEAMLNKIFRRKEPGVWGPDMRYIPMKLGERDGRPEFVVKRTGPGPKIETTMFCSDFCAKMDVLGPAKIESPVEKPPKKSAESPWAEATKE